MAAAQCGHAFLASFLTASFAETAAYLGPNGFTKIVLAVPDEAALRRAYEQAKALKLPCSLWTEDDGVTTTLGIGPVARALARPVTKGLSLMK